MSTSPFNKNAAPGGKAEGGSFCEHADNAILAPVTQAVASPENPQTACKARTHSRQAWVQAELFPGQWPTTEDAE